MSSLREEEGEGEGEGDVDVDIGDDVNANVNVGNDQVSYTPISSSLSFSSSSSSSPTTSTSSSSSPTATTTSSTTTLQATLQRCYELLATADILLFHSGAGLSADSGLLTFDQYQHTRSSSSSFSSSSSSTSTSSIPTSTSTSQSCSYRSLCTPALLHSAPSLFFGFWGHMCNSYRECIPHEGYRILLKWKNNKFHENTMAAQMIREEIAQQIHRRQISQAQQQVKQQRPPVAGHRITSIPNSLNPEPVLNKDELPVQASAFFAATSNIDSHFFRTGFERHEVLEIHGTLEEWQCERACTPQWWTPKQNFRFDVDEDSMLAVEKTRAAAYLEHIKDVENGEDADNEEREEDDIASICWTNTSSFLTNRPTCPFGLHLARPRVLMFDDVHFIHDRLAEQHYIDWMNALFAVVEKHPSLNVVVLEIGCGTSVPTMRLRSQAVHALLRHETVTNLSDCSMFEPTEIDQRNNNSEASTRRGHRVFIRVNSEFPEIETASTSISCGHLQQHHSVRMTALPFLKKMDEMMQNHPEITPLPNY